MKRKTLITILVIITMLAMSGGMALADPQGANTTVGSTSRYSVGSSGSSGTASAYAGNVTQVDINGTAVTTGWQGFYGDVFGNIVLGNSNNDTLYDWSGASLGGEVYSSINSSITWSTTNCSNATHQATAESQLNFGTASDGIDETFSSTYAWFLLGTNNLTSCPSTTLNNAAGQSADWPEILLYDTTASGLVYVSIINQDTQGFDGTNYDYQMIVAEDGHASDTSTTTYYFWAELE